MKAIERIIQYIDYKGLNNSSFEKKNSLSNGYVATQMKRNADLGEGILNKILDNCLDINPEWLLTGNGAMLREDTKLSKTDTGIPLIPIEAMAGYSKGEMRVSDEDIQDRYVIPEFSRKGVEYIIRVSGSSMYPKYSNGDLLGCKPIKDTTFFQWGKPYVLDTDQGALIKRLYPVKDKEDVFECRSDNSEMYPPFQIHKSSIYRVAIVVGVIRQE